MEKIMKTNKKFLKIAALTVAVLLIAGVCLFANSLVGNPVSKAVAKNAAEAYIEENYKDLNLELDRVSYSFKDSYYHAYVTDPDNMDGDFTLLINMWGKVCLNTYDDRVAGGWNTADRIRADYRNTVKSLLADKAFPYNVYLGHGDIEFISREYRNAPTVPSYALVTEDLTVGTFQNTDQWAAKAGKLTIYLDDPDTSAARLAEILLNIKGAFDQAGVPFYAIDCILEYNGTEDAPANDGRLEVVDFLYADIYEEGLTDRVKAAAQAAKYDYTEQSPDPMMGMDEIE